MWKYFLCATALCLAKPIRVLYQRFQVDTCTLSVKFSPNFVEGPMYVFHYVPRTQAVRIQREYWLDGSEGKAMINQLISFAYLIEPTNEIKFNGNEVYINGIFIDEEIMAVLSPTSQFVMPQYNFFHKLFVLIFLWQS